MADDSVVWIQAADGGPADEAEWVFWQEAHTALNLRPERCKPPSDSENHLKGWIHVHSSGCAACAILYVVGMIAPRNP